LKLIKEGTVTIKITLRRGMFMSLFFLIVTAQLCFSGQESGNISTSFSPSVAIPIGESSSFYNIGGGGEVNINFPIPGISSLSINSGLGYSYLPVQADIALSEISLGAGIGYELQLIPLFSFYANANGGYYLGILPFKSGNSSFGTGFMIEGGGGILLNFSPNISIRLGASYKSDISLYNGVKVYLAADLRQGKAGSGKGNLEIQQTDIQRIFPVFYKYYDANSLGSIRVKNTEPGAIRDLRISFYVNQFMERPKLSTSIAQVGAGEAVTVPLFGLFKDGVFSIFEETAVSGEISISYDFNGEDRTMSLPETVYIANRNSMTWDDDRKAAAFVQAKDPGVIKFGKNIANTINSTGSTALNEQFRSAAGIFTSLKDLGITYVQDPATPHEKLSQDDKAIDYLQFPWQTIDYKSGDCDDLSILYTSLLESVGIQAAFITIPGHIYSAFLLGLTENDTKRLFAKTDAFIFKDGETWVPVETTLIPQGFLAAWKEGAKEWKDSIASKKAVLIPIRSAWEVYKPVGFRTNTDKDFPMPSSSLIAKEFTSLISSFVDSEVSVQEIASRSFYKSGSTEALNWLAILNYRLGNDAKAKELFARILTANDKYVPAIVNIGNIEFLEGHLKKAEEYYQNANSIKPGNPGILMAMAKVYFELEQFDSAKELYQKVASVNTELAKQNSYIVAGVTDASRAADKTVKSEDMVWINQ
jgi:tetratricopeptide (TPR) repeat protein